ncbi:hypothetical protein ACTOB_007671 [Actinoplanes oblitus]|uniref:Uncharacterized protein n=1 Tax=Actinoplanes oblitus TaxID=3040509 RepID=A0ABY8WCG7_9ACTN|nr:hypothetical protein [Actinoplanes oblitus]WIM95554.1 hypothetical protein ACTOB_007671 [Actinoplanes oblitus]
MLRYFQQMADGLREAEEPARLPPPPPSQPNLTVQVESRDACFPFEVRLLVRYAVLDHAVTENPFAVATAGVLRRARTVARDHKITETVLLSGELEIALSKRLEVDATGVVAWASCLQVSANEQLREAVWRYEALRRQETMRVWSREAEEAEIAYLGRLLDDPSRATAWWFRRNPEAIQQLPEIARTFKALRAELAGSDDLGTGDGGDGWDGIFADFQRRADPAARLLLAHQLHQVFVEHQLADLADRARLLDGNPPVR